MQRLILCSFMTFVFFLIEVGLSFPGRAEDRLDTGWDHLVPEKVSTSGMETVFTGQIRFEPRYTRVPESLCRTAPCQSSRLYWSLVIYAGKVRYLFDQEMVAGGDRAPEFLEIQGVKFAPGATVTIQGKVSEGSPDLFFLLNIEKIDLVH